MEQHSQSGHNHIMMWCAVITAALGILAFLGIREYTDLLGPARAGSSQRNSNKKDQIDVPKDPLADGTAYYVTLYAPEVGTSEWTNAESVVSDLVFKSPKDKRRWVSLDIQKWQHFQKFYIGIEDYRGGVSNNVPLAGQAKEGDQINLQTQEFKAVATFIEIKTQSDPDTDRPFDRIFEKVVLRILLAENQSKP